MCSLEKRKELAVRQMRAAAVLYEMREKAEKDMAEDDDMLTEERKPKLQRLLFF